MNDASIALPRFWVGICLLVWGAFTDQVALGFGLAIVAEFGNLSPVKWELSDQHFYRVADLTSVFFAVVAIYQFNEHSIYGIYRILALLPVCVFPLLMAERYSTTGAIPLSALFLSQRRRVKGGHERERFVGVSFPFGIVCILAASGGEVPEMLYLSSIFILVTGALLAGRVKRYSLPTWAAAAIAVGVVAFGIQAGVRLAQRQIEGSFSYWVNQFAWFQTDPNRTLTAIGSIGRLKLSDRIRVRVKAPLSTPVPITLREASYSKFNLGMWSLSDGQFSAIDPVAGSPVWILENEIVAGGTRTASLVIDHARDVGVAPLPYGTTRVFGAEVIEVQRNQYGTTLVEALPGQLEYSVSWTNGDAPRPPPAAADSAIPENYSQVLRQIAAEIGLMPDDTNAAALARVEDFFRDNFKYSLIQQGFYPGRTALAHFLLQDRKGHCEYFATATALLLRQAGIPARYAVGYVVSEYSPLEKAFVARARHAHSWAEAFIDNRWITVDTTPGEWYGLEQAHASNWQGVQDLLSWIGNRYARFQRTDRDFVDGTLLWLVPPLFLLLLWRLRSRARTVLARQQTRPAIRGEQGLDSELYGFSGLLRARGFTLRPGDTLKAFLNRNVDADVAGVRLVRLLELHYRYRFAEKGLSLDERDELRGGSEEYCRRYAKDPG